MEIGLGVLHLSPSVFWNEYTVPELMAAIDGYVESQGGKREDEADELSTEEKDQLLADMEKERTPAHKAKLKVALANVKKMAAEKRALKAKKTAHANRS